MTSPDPWLTSTWPFVRDQLPSAPSAVLEIGCGALGGFVPSLLADGYEAVGADPGGTILRALDARFDRRVLTESPYLFCDLDDTSAADEQIAIDANVIQATGLSYAGSNRLR
jgi:hypothetical protein